MKTNELFLIAILLILFIPYLFMPLHIDDMLFWKGANIFKTTTFIHGLNSPVKFMGISNLTIYNFTHPFFYLYIAKYFVILFGMPGLHPIIFHIPFYILFILSLYTLYKAYKINTSSLFLFLIPPVFVLATMTSIDIISFSMLIIGLAFLKKDKHIIASIFFTLSWFGSYQAFWIFFPLFFTLNKKDFIKIFTIPFATLIIWMIWSYLIMGISHPFVSLLWPGIELSERFTRRINIIKSFIAFWGLLVGMPLIFFTTNKNKFYFLLILLIPLIAIKALFLPSLLFFITFIISWYKNANKFEKIWFISYSLILIAIFPVISARYMLYAVFPAIMPFVRNYQKEPSNLKKISIAGLLVFSFILSAENFIEANNYAYLSSSFIRKNNDYSAEWGAKYYAWQNNAHYITKEELSYVNTLYIFRQNPHIRIMDPEWVTDTFYTFEYSPFIPIRLSDIYRATGFHSSYKSLLPFTLYRGVSEELILLKKLPLSVKGKGNIVFMNFDNGSMPMYFLHAPAKETHFFNGKGNILFYAGLPLNAFGSDGVKCILTIDTLSDTFSIKRGQLIKKSYHLEDKTHTVSIEFKENKTSDSDWSGWKIVYDK